MKRLTLLSCILLMTGIIASAQDPQGAVSYSLPKTNLCIDVEAVQENFHAGPYAEFAKKYLGIEVALKDEQSCHLTKVTVTPKVEADFSARYSMVVPAKAFECTFLSLCAGGLVAVNEGSFGQESVWRFPSAAKAQFAAQASSSNLQLESTTLYKNVKGDNAWNQVAVQQAMVVEKSADKRAQEAAEMIFSLRKKRVQIITGDTDMTYSGEAMGAAIAEMTLLEQQYMTLFTGYTDSQVQTMHFELVPDASKEEQKYIAFRISDISGVVGPENLSGSPVLLELVPDKPSRPVNS
ncbi:MAG: DUF4831 family protein [Bacteroidales bacterium]|nr:DUF4831 family protein [Bacteroidales bacterium]